MPPCPVVVGQIAFETAFISQQRFVGEEVVAVPCEKVGLFVSGVGTLRRG